MTDITVLLIIDLGSGRSVLDIDPPHLTGAEHLLPPGRGWLGRRWSRPGVIPGRWKSQLCSQWMSWSLGGQGRRAGTFPSEVNPHLSSFVCFEQWKRSVFLGMINVSMWPQFWLNCLHFCKNMSIMCLTSCLTLLSWLSGTGHTQISFSGLLLAVRTCSH